MDETLICSKFKSQINQDEESQPFLKPDFEIELDAEGSLPAEKVFVIMRPNLIDTLEYLANHFEVIVFTAAE